MQKTKTLKVYCSTGKPSPKINLQGKWLSNLGFDIGNYIEVTLEDNKLIITKIDNPNDLPTVNIKTTIKKNTLDVVKEQAVNYCVNENEVIEKALIYYFKKKGVL